MRWATPKRLYILQMDPKAVWDASLSPGPLSERASEHSGEKGDFRDQLRLEKGHDLTTTTE